MIFVMAAVEWFRWLMYASHQLIQMTMLAICFAAFVGWRFYRGLHELPNSSWD